MSERSELGIPDFVRFFLTFDRNQRVTFLQNISQAYLDILREIVLNLLLNKEIQHTEKEKKYLNSNIRYLREIASKYIPLSRKRVILVHKQLLMKKVVFAIKKYLQI